MSDIPIVGEPARILIWYPTVIINCNCSLPALSMIVITGIENYVQCGRCGTTHAVEGFVPDGKGGVDINLKALPPIPQGVIQ